MIRKTLENDALLVRVVLTCMAAGLAGLILAGLRWGAWGAYFAGLTLFGALLLSVVLGLIVSVVTDARVRRRKLAALAARHGWSYRKEHDRALAARVPSFLVPADADYLRFTHVVAGTAHGWPFLSFHRLHTSRLEHADSFGSGEQTTFFNYWFVLLTGLPAGPAIWCRPRAVADDGVGFRAGDDPGNVEAVSYPDSVLRAGLYPAGFRTGDGAFDAAFYLDGPAALLAGGLASQIADLTPRLAADRQFPWLLAGGTLLTWKKQRLGEDASPAELEPLLAAVAVLAELLGQHEWHGRPEKNGDTVTR